MFTLFLLTNINNTISQFVMWINMPNSSILYTSSIKMKNRLNMLSFELTAIDLILVIAVIVLIVLYWTKLSKIPEEQFLRESIAKDTIPKKITSNPQNSHAECPRGFGYIKNIGDNGSISERCLGCYRIMECYSEQEEIRPQLNQV